MAEKVRQTVAQKFREEATDEQWLELVDDHDNITGDEFKEKYGFTWSAVMNDAVEKGLYTKKKNSGEHTDTRPEQEIFKNEFRVRDIPKGIKKKQRSIELYDDISKRLNDFRNDKCQYTFASILNQLLDEALKKYGY